MGLEGTSIRVKDMRKSLDFYTKRMGMRVTGRSSYVPGEKVVSLESRDTGQKLSLMYFAKNCVWYTPYKEDGSELDHLTFEFKQAKKTYEKLIAEGAPKATEFWGDEKGGMGLVKDPNGIWIAIRGGRRRKK